MMADLFDIVAMNKHLIKPGESWVPLTDMANVHLIYDNVHVTYIGWSDLGSVTLSAFALALRTRAVGVARWGMLLLFA